MQKEHTSHRPPNPCNRRRKDCQKPLRLWSGREWAAYRRQKHCFHLVIQQNHPGAFSAKNQNPLKLSRSLCQGMWEPGSLNKCLSAVGVSMDCRQHTEGTSIFLPGQHGKDFQRGHPYAFQDLEKLKFQNEGTQVKVLGQRQINSTLIRRTSYSRTKPGTKSFEMGPHVKR